MSTKRKRILCVDDDPETCYLTQTYLEMEGYEVIIASSAAEGLRLAKSQRFDLYLFDSGLPDEPGVDLAQQIRMFDSATPIIFHSGHAYDADIRKGVNAGAQAYITKPSNPNEVIEVINTLITEREAGSREEGNAQIPTSRCESPALAVGHDEA